LFLYIVDINDFLITKEECKRSEGAIRYSKMVKVTLKLFKWVYFIIALVPLRWEFDEDSGRLNSFKFSFYYPETWWYLSMLVSQTIIVVMMTIKSWHDITDILTETGHDSVM